MKRNIHISQRNVTLFKQLFIIAMAVLTIADVFFVLTPTYSTISQIVLYSSPEYMVFIWLFGLMTANFFFPRKKSTVKIKKSTSVLVSLTIAIILLITGHVIHKEKTCTADFPSFKDVPFYMEITCREYKNNIRVNCKTLTCKQQNQTYILQDVKNTIHELRYDLTPEIKLLLMIFGFISGYIIWPQSIEGNIT